MRNLSLKKGVEGDSERAGAIAVRRPDDGMQVKPGVSASTSPANSRTPLEVSCTGLTVPVTAPEDPLTALAVPLTGFESPGTESTVPVT